METEKRRGERIKGNRRRYRWQEEERKEEKSVENSKNYNTQNAPHTRSSCLTSDF